MNTNPIRPTATRSACRSERPATTQQRLSDAARAACSPLAADRRRRLADRRRRNIGARRDLLALGAIAFLFVLCGFYLLQPNQAAAILLFGDYKGTDRTHGLRWGCPG